MAWGISTYNRVPIKRACNGYYLRWWYSGWHYWFFLPGKYTVNTQGENYKTIGTREIAMATGQVTRSECDAIRTIMNTREVYLLTVAGWMNIRIEPGSANVYNNMVAGSEFEFVAIIGSKEITYTTGYSPVPGDGTIPEVPVVPPDIGYCEVIIGTQIWMCKNWDANYPNSKVYNNDEANRPLYGGLYSNDQIHSPGFCPAGWHVPTEAEWDTLIAYIGGLVTGGGVLKEVGFTSWNAPNTGAVDTYGFTMKGAGAWQWQLGIGIGFNSIYQISILWSGTLSPYRYVYAFRYDTTEIFKLPLGAPTDYSVQPFYSVRMIKDVAYTSLGVIDFDGIDDRIVLSAHPNISGVKTIRFKLWLKKVSGLTDSGVLNFRNLGTPTDELWISIGGIPGNRIQIGTNNANNGHVHPLAGLGNQILECVVVKSAGDITSLTINGVSKWLTHTLLAQTIAPDSCIAYSAGGFLEDAIIWDVSVDGEHSWKGYPMGNTDAAWVDTINGVNGIVEGSPILSVNP